MKGGRPGEVAHQESATEGHFASVLQGSSGDSLGSTSDLPPPGRGSQGVDIPTFTGMG